jgi:Family of unknown function (DUF695)/Regulator of ribonuclease activity B
MSDHWEQFPCTMANYAAFISYDHGIREELKLLPFPNFASFKVELLSPDDRGFPSGDEFAKLNEVEDFLCSQFLVETRGVQVGRVTANGRRYFHFYTCLDEFACDRLAQEAGKIHGHMVAHLHEPDLERSHYWNELYPTEDDWQVIKDIRVQEALELKGDPLQTPRPIEHWVYFATEIERVAFIECVKAAFEEIDLYESTDPKKSRFAAKLKHSGLPDYRSMNGTTLLLSRAARENGGEYDGWETQVCKD